ncbi:MAG: diaminopimelate epimerase [Chloroflexota bacterium]
MESSKKSIPYTKYQAAGNAYIVANESGFNISSRTAKTICSSTYGVGSDGIVCWEGHSRCFHVQIINPDGSLAEKSGNGLRILATFLFEKICKTQKHIVLKTVSSTVNATLKSAGDIVLEMGKPVFGSDPISSGNSSIFPEEINMQSVNQVISGYSVSMGNPHFVIFVEDLDLTNAQKLGPLIENHPFFPNRSNVQFVKPINRSAAKAIIWERGAGYTLSSGSSSCAIYAVMNRLGLCDDELLVQTTGGKLEVWQDETKTIWLKGPVKKVTEGIFFT